MQPRSALILFFALLTQKTLTTMCLSNLPILSLPLSSSIHNYLSDPALLGVQYWPLTIYLNFYLGSPAPCTHNQFLPLTFLPMALPSPSESFLVPSSPELQHSVGCQIIYNLPIHQLESILSFLFLLLPLAEACSSLSGPF